MVQQVKKIEEQIPKNHAAMNGLKFKVYTKAFDKFDRSKTASAVFRAKNNKDIHGNIYKAIPANRLFQAKAMFNPAFVRSNISLHSNFEIIEYDITGEQVQLLFDAENKNYELLIDYAHYMQIMQILHDEVYNLGRRYVDICSGGYNYLSGEDKEPRTQKSSYEEAVISYLTKDNMREVVEHIAKLQVWSKNTYIQLVC